MKKFKKVFPLVLLILTGGYIIFLADGYRKEVVFSTKLYNAGMDLVHASELTRKALEEANSGCAFNPRGGI